MTANEAGVGVSRAFLIATSTHPSLSTGGTRGIACPSGFTQACSTRVARAVAVANVTTIGGWAHELACITGVGRHTLRAEAVAAYPTTTANGAVDETQRTRHVTIATVGECLDALCTRRAGPMTSGCIREAVACSREDVARPTPGARHVRW
jgi:hypothetical protein